MRTAVAALARRPGVTEVVDMEVPPPGEAEGVLEVEACGVCGSDWAVYGGKTGGRLFPLILGHEVVGRLGTLGAGAAEEWGVATGDRVVVQEFIPCFRCSVCRRGSYALCASTDFVRNPTALRYGFTPVSVAPSIWGGYSEMMHLHARSLVHRIDESVPAAEATLFVPISNGVRWVTKDGAVGLGQRVLVLGPGQHGLGCVVAAHHAGAGAVVAVGTAQDEARLEVACALGADHGVVADTGAFVQSIQSATGIDDFDLVLDVTGDPSAVGYAFELAAPGGRVVLAGFKEQAVTGPPSDTIVRKELTVIGVRGRDPDSVSVALDLIGSRRFPFELMCTHEYDLNGVDEALRVVGRQLEPQAIHVTVRPEGIGK